MVKLISRTKTKIVETYDIINVTDNNNYVVKNFVVHNSAADWARKENKELKKKLAEIRTKHHLFILNFPLSIKRIESNYLNSFVNYWIHLTARGSGAIFVPDMNPANDPWRLKAFEKLGSYSEFSSKTKIEQILKKHPNFWTTIRFPKPPKWLYSAYLKVREKNVYDDNDILKNVSSEDIIRALLILALRDIVTTDETITMNRMLLHIKNKYDIKIKKQLVFDVLEDSKQLVLKIQEKTGGAKKIDDEIILEETTENVNE